MSDFDLDSVLKQIMEGDDAVPKLDAPGLGVVAAVAQAGAAGGDKREAAGVQAVAAVDAAFDGLPGDAVPLMTAPADTTVVTGDSYVADDDGAPSGVALPMVSFPQFTTADVAAQLDIRNFATLCKLKVRKWIGRKRDKTAAKKAESDHGSVDGTYTAYKKLFAGTEDKLKAVNSVLDSARTRHYQMTLPWSTTGLDDSGRRDGPRLLANTLFMEYITEMGQAKQMVLAKLGELRNAYPTLLVEAQKNLGSAFVVTDYPTVDDLESMFTLDFEFNPVPDGMDFKGLPAQQAQKLADRLNQSRRACLENAMKDVWQRMHVVVLKMAERLGDPKHTFHDTLVTNVRETADLMRHLNATGDPKVEAIRVKIEADLCKYEPGILREDLRKRALTASLARNILEDMERGAGTS